MMENPNWDAEKMFKMYLLDYLVKKNNFQTAAAFAKEAGVELCPAETMGKIEGETREKMVRVSRDCCAIDSPISFLNEWWTVFYDAFMSRRAYLLAKSEGAQNKGKQIIVDDRHDEQFQLPKSDIGPEKPAQKGKQIIDDKFQLSKSDTGPEKPMWLPIVSNITKMLDQPELEQLAYGPGVLRSSSKFPFTDFSDLQNSVGGKSSSSWFNKDPQQLLQAKFKSDQLGGNILNFGGTADDSGFGASGAMLGNYSSNNLDFQNAVNYKPLHRWPSIGAGQMPTSMQQELFPQSMGHTAGFGTSTLPGNSSDLRNSNQALFLNGLGGSSGQIDGSNELSSFQYYLLGLLDKK